MGESGWIQTKVFAFNSQIFHGLWYWLHSVTSQGIHTGEEAQPGATRGIPQGQIVSITYFFFPLGHQTNLKEFAQSSGWESDDGELLGPQVVNLTLKTRFLLISSLMTNLSFYKWNWIGPK